MSDHRERSCTICGSLLHHEDDCHREHRRPAPTASPALRPTKADVEQAFAEALPIALEKFRPALPEGAAGDVETVIAVADAYLGLWEMPKTLSVSEGLEAARRLALAVQSQSSTMAELEADLREAREYLNRLFGGYTDANEQWHCNYCDVELEDDECENSECWAVKARAFLVRTRPAAIKPVAPGKETL